MDSLFYCLSLLFASVVERSFDRKRTVSLDNFALLLFLSFACKKSSSVWS
jgi:hypothetical protein